MTPASMYKRSEHDVSFVSLSADMARTLHTMARLSNSGWCKVTRRKLTSELVTHGMHADRAEAAVTALLDCGKLEFGSQGIRFAKRENDPKGKDCPHDNDDF